MQSTLAGSLNPGTWNLVVDLGHVALIRKGLGLHPATCVIAKMKLVFSHALTSAKENALLVDCGALPLGLPPLKIYE